MEFSRDIMLLYNHNDEANIDYNGIWKENFVKYLKFTLSKTAGPDIEFESFNMLSGNVHHEIMTSRLIILLVDDPFLESNVSDQILNVFSKNAETDGVLQPHDRLLPIVTSNFPREMYPDAIKNLFGYDFTSVRIRDRMIKEKESRFGHSKTVQTFWLKTLDLSKDIANKLKGFTSPTTPKLNRNKTVYLAQTTNELIDIRDSIKRDLVRHGYTVIPDQRFVPADENIEKQIDAHLNTCQMSIHLIGEEYGDIYSENLSISDIQNKRAEEHSARINSDKSKERFYRVIWINPESEITSEEQKNFTNNIKRDIESKEESDLLQSSVEELKSFIRSNLNRLNDKDNNAPKHPETKTSRNKNSVYLIHDRNDYALSEEVTSFLTEHGFKVVLPEFEGQIFELENYHRDKLINCDACLVIAGTASQKWIDTKLKDIEKIHGFGRIKPIIAKAIYATSNGKNGHNLPKSNGTIVIKNKGQISEKAMEPFLDKFSN